MHFTTTAKRLIAIAAVSGVMILTRTIFARRAKLNADLLVCISRDDDSCVIRLIKSGASANGTGLPGDRSNWQRARTILRILGVKYEAAPSPPLAYSLEERGVTTAYPYKLVFLPEDTVITSALLQAGASANCTTWDGESALTAAIMTEKYSTAMYLVEYGANPNVTCRLNGDSALMLAVSDNQVGLVKLLVSKGANVNFATAAGETAVSVCRHDQQGEIIRRYLLQHRSDGTVHEKS